MKAQYTSDKRYRVQQRGKSFYLQMKRHDVKPDRTTDVWTDHGGAWDDKAAALQALKIREPRV